LIDIDIIIIGMADTQNNYLEKTPLLLPQSPSQIDSPNQAAQDTRETEEINKVVTFDQAMTRSGGLGISSYPHTLLL